MEVNQRGEVHANLTFVWSGKARKGEWIDLPLVFFHDLLDIGTALRGTR
jgi:hypothetical protein